MKQIDISGNGGDGDSKTEESSCFEQIKDCPTNNEEIVSGDNRRYIGRGTLNSTKAANGLKVYGDEDVKSLSRRNQDEINEDGQSYEIAAAETDERSIPFTKQQCGTIKRFYQLKTRL